MDPVCYRVDSGVATLTFANPDAGNRLDPTSLGQISHYLGSAFGDADVRAIVLRSSGATFCLGMDLEALLRDTDGTPDPASDTTAASTPAAETGTAGAAGALERSVRLYADILRALSDSSKPTVAIVQGAVKAGGVGLVAACDVVLADEEATFELSEVLLGLIPANVLPYLVAWRCTPARARYLVLTARRLSAAEAFAFGLVDEVFPRAAAEKGVRGVLKGLLRANPGAMTDAKRFTRVLLSAERHEGMERAIGELIGRATLPEVRAGIAAFAEGDLPDWFAPFKPRERLTFDPDDGGSGGREK